MIKLWRPEERVYVALNLNINENGKLDDEDKIIYHTITKEDGYSEGVYRKVCVNFRLLMIIF